MLSLLRLVRAQNLLTAVSDSWAGFALVSTMSSAVPVRTLLPLAIASASLYAAGAILNDLADMARDRFLHPARPLPSGSVRPSSAFLLALALMAVGIISAATVSAATFVFALVVGAGIVTYDFAAKRRPVQGSLTMGLLRLANFSLGLFAVAGAAPLTPEQVAVPTMIAMHVFAVTLASNCEGIRLAGGRRHTNSGDVPAGKVLGADGHYDAGSAWRLSALVSVLLLLLLIDYTAMGGLWFLLPPRPGAHLALAFCAAWAGVSGAMMLKSLRAISPARAIGRHVSNGVQGIAVLNASIALAYGNVMVGIILLLFAPIGVILAEYMGGA